MPKVNIDYSNTIFYKIYCKNPDVNDLYIGHTTNFVQRKHMHKQACIKETNPNYHVKLYKFIREHGGWDEWKMEIIGFRDCYDHYEARKIEQQYFEELKATLNSIDPLPKPKPRKWICDVCNISCETENLLHIHKDTKNHIKKMNVILNNDLNKMSNILSQKVAKKFVCNNCNYICNKKSDYSKHLLTTKHKNNCNLITTNDNNSPKTIEYSCDCGKNYKYRQGLHKHKKTCSIYQGNDIIESPSSLNKLESLEKVNNTDKELLIKMLLKNQDIMEKMIEIMPNLGNTNE